MRIYHVKRTFLLLTAYNLAGVLFPLPEIQLAKLVYNNLKTKDQQK